jgi:endo-1,4-beta-xylanase
MNWKSCLFVSGSVLLAGSSYGGEPIRTEDSTSLQAKFGSKFVVGVALGGRLPDDYSKVEQNLIVTQFGSITPENCMKMTQIQPREGQFDFEQADALVAYSQAHKMQVVGHTLVWAKDERTPPWVFLDGDKPASRELVLQRMKTHIQTVVGRYRGKIASWDVVNEALDDSEPYYRPSSWLKIVGPEFIPLAFEWTREADPAALLVYNDYNVELPAKREKLLRLIRELREKNVPLQAIGIQGHWEVDQIPMETYRVSTLVRSRMSAQARIWSGDGDRVNLFSLVPTLCVGMQSRTLRVLWRWPWH